MARLEIEVLSKGVAGLLADIDKIKGATKDIRPIRLDISGSGGQTFAKTVQDAKIATEEARKAAVELSNTIKNSLAESFNNAKIRTEELKQATEGHKQALLDDKRAIEQNKAATEAQKTATEAQRTATEAEKTALMKLKAVAQEMRNERIRGISTQNAASDSLVGMRQRLNDLRRQFDLLTESERKNANTTKTLVPEIQRLNNEISKAEQLTGRYQRQVGKYGSALTGAIPYLGQLTTVAGIAALAVQGLQKSFQTNLKFDAIEYALERVSGSTENYRTNIEFLNRSADRLGVNLYTLMGAFRQWEGAVQHSNITSEQSRDIFEAVANAGAKMKLSTDQIQGTFLALSQMLSKGVVSMEELRRQLGDRLPGAFAIAAKSMGMTEAEFNKLVASGRLMSEDFLPKFANELNKAFGNDHIEKIDSMQASVARLGNEFDRLFRSENATNFFKIVTDGLADTTSRLNNLVNSKGFEDFFLRVSSLATAPIETLIGTNATGEVANELNRIVEAQEKLNSLGIPWTTFIPESAIYQYKGFTEQIKENSKSVLKNKKYWEDLSKSYKEQLSNLDISQKGSAQWNDLNNKIKEADKNVKLYTESGKTALATIRDFATEINNVFKSDTDKSNLVGLFGLDRIEQETRNRYQRMLDEVGKIETAGLKKHEKNEKEKTRISEAATKERVEINAAMESELAQKRIDFAEKAEQKLAELEARAGITRIKSREQDIEANRAYWNKVEADAKNYGITAEQLAELRKASEARINADWDAKMLNTSLDLQRRVNESALQIAFRRVNDEYRMKEKGLEDFVAKLRADGKTQEEIAKQLAEKKLKIQKDYDKKIAELNQRQREMNIVTSFDGSATSIEIANVNDKMDKLRMAFEAGGISGKAFLSEMSDLSVQREQLELLQQSIDGVSGAFGNFFGDAIFDTENALKNLGEAFKSLAKTAISELAKIAIKQALNMSIGNAALGLTTKASIAAAKAMAAAWAPVAASVSLSTLGANSIPAAAAVNSVFGLTKSLSMLPGHKKGGYTGNMGINDVAGIVHGQEYVFDAASTRRIGVDNLKALQMGRVSPEDLRIYTSVDRSIDVSRMLRGTDASLPSRHTNISTSPQRVDVVVHGEISGENIKLVHDKANRDFNRYFGRN